MAAESTDRPSESTAPRAVRAVPKAGLRQAAALLLVSLVLAGCATSSVMRKGREAEQAQDYDRAVVQYTLALKENPDNVDARSSLERAKLRASQFHLNNGRRNAAAGRLEEALLEYQIAAEMNPSSSEADKELRQTRNQLRAKVAVSREGKTALETLIERTRDVPPPGLDLPSGLKLPASLVFRSAGSRDVYTALARFADVNLVFDPDFRDVPITIDLRNSTFQDAVRALSTTTRTFYRVSAPGTITIIPDTAEKRREYEDEVVRTFYLSNADPKETIDLLRMVIDLRRIAPIVGTNAVSVRDSAERVQAAGRIIAAIDKARPEVVVDVELLEVNRSRMLDYGIQFASPGTSGPAGISGSVDVNRAGMTLLDLRSLTSAGVFLSGVPALYYRLMKGDTNTRVLANPQLRTIDGVAAQARFGDRVPVPTTVFTPIATGGVPQQPVTSFNYENIGVNIDLTPRTHHDDDVSLLLKVEVSSISGTGYGGLPTFGNRTVSSVIRLKDGETSILAGLIRDDERTTLEGMAGISQLPVIGRLFGRTKKERQETDSSSRSRRTSSDSSTCRMRTCGRSALAGTAASCWPSRRPTRRRATRRSRSSNSGQLAADGWRPATGSAPPGHRGTSGGR
jgi:general secretion pathway protein D